MASKPKILGRIGCILLRYSYYTSISSSAINLVCIAINRYVGIVRSKLYRKMFAKTYRKFWIIGVWCAPVAFYFPPVIIKTTERATSASYCGVFATEIDVSWLPMYLTVLISMLQIFPVIVLTGFYRAILVKVKKCRKTVEHHPLTNTPTYCGSYMGNSCALKSTNSPDYSPKQTQAGRAVNAIRRGSSRKSDDDMVGDRKEDINEGRKAIIMAYLEVPPTSVSPRKNPGTLYKRSPPQTRTMVVEKDNEEKNQVLISGTTSSPNLFDKTEQEESFTDNTRRLSKLAWCRQRSFSTGDEEIEPERGMVGDNENDLKQQNSFAVSESTQSFDDSTPQSTPPIEICESQQHFHYEKNMFMNPSRLKVDENIERVVASYPRKAIEPRENSVKQQTLASPPSCRYLNIPHPSTESIDRMGLKKFNNEAKNRRRVRGLTRQDYVNEDETANASEPKHVSSKDKPIKNTQRTMTANPTDGELTSCLTRHEMQTDDSALKANLTTGSIKSGTKPCAEVISPKEEKQISRTARCVQRDIMDRSRMESQDEIQNQSNVANSKRFLYRRGGSDRTGVKWLGRFRKSKNWSVTSMIPPKLKNRAISESRNNTVIKIVIDHATEEVSETWLGEVMDDTEEDSSNEFTKKPCEGECDDLSVIPEQLTNPTENSVENKSSTTRTSAQNATVKRGNVNSWWSLFRKNWKGLITKSENNDSKAGQKTLRDIDGLGDTNERTDRQVNIGMVTRKRLSNKKDQRPGESAQQRFPAELWSNIAEGSSNKNKPAVILPMPSLPMGSHDSKSPHDDAKELAKNECTSGQRESGSTCKSFQDDQSDCDDSIRTSSNCAHRDSDLSSREDAELLRKRREMNTSTQFLRAKTVSSKNDDNHPFLDLNSVELGRRWSVQSDAISIYSERLAKPLERSHSNCSRYSQKRSSKSSDHGHRRSFRSKWSSKKSSLVSSTGSSFKRKRRRIAERKLAYSGILICIAFALCMLPISIVDVLQKLLVYVFIPDVKFGLIVLSWAHVVANPILYGFLNSQFRKEYKGILKDFWNFVARKERSRGLLSGRSAIVKAMRDQYQS